MFPPEEEFPDLLVKADLTAEKRLSDFLTDYLVESMWGGSYYEGPTELDISGEITRADLDVIFQIKTIRKIDAEHASFMDNTVPSYAFCIDAGMYQIGITTLEEVILPVNIKAIDPMSFTGCERLSKVNFEQLNSLSRIGMNAFDKCGFVSIYIPEKCTDMAESAFSYCVNMEQIGVDPKNTKYEAENNALYNKIAKALILYPKMSKATSLVVKAGTDSIIAACFTGNESLEQITLPNTLTKLGRGAFEQMTKLKSIRIPGSVKEIEALFSGSAIENVELGEGVEILGGALFNRCKNLQAITLPKSIKEIGFMAFADCDNLASVNFQDLSSLNLIDDRAFYNCKSLKSVDLSKATALKTIGVSAFKDCASIHTLMLPDGLKSIAYEAFMNCEMLDLKQYPSALTYIGNYAFGNNRSLTTIAIGEYVNFLGNGVFSNCRSVTDLRVNENNVDYVLYENMIMTSDGSAVVYASPETSIEELDLSEMKELGDYVLAGNKSIKRIILGYGLTSIGQGAFEDMTQLESINLSYCTDLSRIGPDAFKGAVKLKSVTFPKDDQSKYLEIGQSAFEGCSLLQEVSLPAQTMSLGVSVFKDCSSLTTVDLSKTNIYAITDAFMNCESLSKLSLNTKINRLGDNTFKNCKSLQSFDIPANVSYNLNAMPFAGSGIKTFTVAATNRAYKAIDGAVYSKDGSQLVICPPTVTGTYTVLEGVKKIAAKSFSGNEKISRVVLPKSLLAPGYQNIEESFHEMHGLTAFEAAEDHSTLKIVDGAIYCNQGKTLFAYPAGKPEAKITLASTTEAIGRAAFNGNKKIEEIVFPDQLARINMSFVNATGLRKIELPASIKSFSSSFDGAVNLSEVICNAVTPPSIDTYTFRNAQVNTVYVPAQSVDAYKADKYWSAYNVLPINPTSVEINKDADLTVTCKDGYVQISSEMQVSEVKAYNLNGQLIKTSVTPNFKLNMSANNLIVISILLENGETVNRKMIVR